MTRKTFVRVRGIMDLGDERDDAHAAAAVGTVERIDLVHLLNQPGQAGLATGVGRWLVDVN